MSAAAINVLIANLRTMLNNLNQRHSVTSAKIKVGLEPVNNHCGFSSRVVVALGMCQRDKLIWGFAGLGLDIVEVGLERHIAPGFMA